MNMNKVRIPLVSSKLPHVMRLQRGNSGDGRDKLTSMLVITTSSLGLGWKLPSISFPPGCRCPFPHRMNRFTLKHRAGLDGRTWATVAHIPVLLVSNVAPRSAVRCPSEYALLWKCLTSIGGCIPASQQCSLVNASRPGTVPKISQLM